jgi:hypothetical protein
VRSLIVPHVQVPERVPAGTAPKATDRARAPQERAPETAFKDRLAICRACPERRDIVGGMMLCGKCGCVCNFKAAIQRARCPIDKW